MQLTPRSTRVLILESIHPLVSQVDVDKVRQDQVDWAVTFQHFLAAGDRQPSIKLTYEALPSTLALDPGLLSLARRPWKKPTYKRASTEEVPFSFNLHDLSTLFLSDDLWTVLIQLRLCAHRDKTRIVLKRYSIFDSSAEMCASPNPVKKLWYICQACGWRCNSATEITKNLCDVNRKKIMENMSPQGQTDTTFSSLCRTTTTWWAAIVVIFSV